MFGIRGIFKNEVLIKGLFFSENKETIPDECLVECSGFILSQGLLKKDHNLVLCSDVPDNIAYYAGGNLPICIAGSELDPEDQEDPPTPSEDVAEYDPYDDEDFDWSYVLAWVSGQMTSMSPGETDYLEVTGNVGDTFWSVDLTNFTGSLTHKKLSNTKSIYKVSDDASGSFTVTVHDAFNDLSKTISVGENDFYINLFSLTSILDGTPIKYSSVTSATAPVEEYKYTRTLTPTDDEGRPVQTLTYITELFRDSISQGEKTAITVVTYEWDGEYWIEVSSVYSGDYYFAYTDGSGYRVSEYTGLGQNQVSESYIFLNKTLYDTLTFYHTYTPVEEDVGSFYSSSTQCYINSSNYIIVSRKGTYSNGGSTLTHTIEVEGKKAGEAFSTSWVYTSDWAVVEIEYGIGVL